MGTVRNVMRGGPLHSGVKRVKRSERSTVGLASGLAGMELGQPLAEVPM